MANLREYRDENGKLKAYYIRVFRGRDADGKQLPPYTETFQVPETWSEATAHKKAEAFAAVFEERCLSGLQANSNQNFRDYPEAEFYTPEEVKSIIAAIAQEPIYWRAIGLLIIFSGGRRGEILGLRYKDLDFDRNRIHVCQSLLYTPVRGKYIEEKPKNKKRRYVTIPAAGMQIVRDYLDWRYANDIVPVEKWKEEDLVFINSDGEPFSPDGVTDWFSNLSKKYGVPHVHPHGFRHSAASALIFNGVDPVSVAGTLGHATPTTTTKIYSHFFEAAEEKNGEIIAEIYGAK